MLYEDVRAQNKFQFVEPRVSQTFRVLGLIAVCACVISISSHRAGAVCSIRWKTAL